MFPLVLGVVMIGGVSFCLCLTTDTPFDKRDVITLVLTAAMVGLLCIGWQNRYGWPGMSADFTTTLYVWMLAAIVGAIFGTLVGHAYHHKTPAG